MPFVGITSMAKLGETRGEATIRIEKELNERWGKGPFLWYEIHMRQYGAVRFDDERKNDVEYETSRWVGDKSEFYKVKREF